jgi:hypothetical protein
MKKTVFETIMACYSALVALILLFLVGHSVFTLYTLRKQGIAELSIASGKVAGLVTKANGNYDVTLNRALMQISPRFELVTGFGADDMPLFDVRRKQSGVEMVVNSDTGAISYRYFPLRYKLFSQDVKSAGGSLRIDIVASVVQSEALMRLFNLTMRLVGVLIISTALLVVIGEGLARRSKKATASFDAFDSNEKEDKALNFDFEKNSSSASIADFDDDFLRLESNELPNSFDFGEEELTNEVVATKSELDFLNDLPSLDSPDLMNIDATDDFTIPEEEDIAASSPNDRGEEDDIFDKTSVIESLTKLLSKADSNDNDLSLLVASATLASESGFKADIMSFFGHNHRAIVEDGGADKLYIMLNEHSEESALSLLRSFLDDKGAPYQASYGLSSRLKRAVTSDILLLEAESALKRAIKAQKTNEVVAFKVDKASYDNLFSHS